MTVWTAVIWVCLGLVAGFLAQLAVPRPGGFVAAAIIGILGAIIGGYIGNYTSWWGEVTGFNFASIIVAVIGSIVLLLILKVIGW